MKKILLTKNFLLLCLLLLVTQMSLAGDWNGQTGTFNFAAYQNGYEFSAGSPITNSSNESVRILVDNGINQMEGRFAVVGNITTEENNNDPQHKGFWRIYNGGLYNGVAGSRTLSILDLFASDIVTINYNNGSYTSGGVTNTTNITFKSSGQANRQNAGAVVSSGTSYTMSSNGTLDLTVGRNVVITSIVIWQSGNKCSFDTSNKYGTKDGLPYYRYRLSSRWFDEPQLTVRPSNSTVTYTVENYNTTLKNNEKVAVMGDNGDIMFINLGWCKVTATASNGMSDSYLVEVWDNEAYFVIEDDGTKYRLAKNPEITDDTQQGGFIKDRVVTGVTGMEMGFSVMEDGTQPNTSVVYLNNSHMVSFANNNDGWWDRYPYNNYTTPQGGTFYYFKAKAKGKLKFGGIKTQTGGKVYLVKIDPANGYPQTEVFTADQSGYLESGWIEMDHGTVYYLQGEANQADNKWSPFLLEYFCYETSFKMNGKYGVAAKSGYDIMNNDNNTITSFESATFEEGFSLSDVTLTIKGYKGNVTGATVNFDSNGHLVFSNLQYKTSEKDKMGGAIKVEMSIEGAGAVEYVMTIPYGQHVWDFRQTAHQSETDHGDYSYNETQLVTMMKDNTTDWSRVYKVHRRESGHWTELISPIMAAQGSIAGNNAFYMDNTTGLVFKTSAQSFGAQENANSNGSIATVDKDEQYQWPYTSTTNADLVWIQGAGASIQFPGVKAGQYIKVYTYRHSDNRGETFTANNLVDLDNVAYDGQTTFKLRGMWESRVAGHTGDRMKGAAIFRVPANYTQTNDPSQIPVLTLTDIGWAQVYKIEISDEYKPDLFLTVGTEDGNLPIDYDGVYSSIVVRKTNGTATPVEKDFLAIVGNVGCQNANTCDYEVIPDNGVDVGVDREIWTSNGGVDYNDLILTFNGGNGLVKLIQRERANSTGYTPSEDAPNASMGYVIDKNEYYIAVGELEAQNYPYTWDFTDYNMYQGNSTTATALGSTEENEYGQWNADDQVENSFGQQHAIVETFGTNDINQVAETTKQLFAQGAQLTAEQTLISEIEGLGVSRPIAATQKQYHYLKTVNGTFGDQVSYYNAYDLQENGITVDGNSLSGVGGITIPDVAAGMYVFVKASAEPSVTGATETEKYSSHVNNLDLAENVYVYKVTTTGDVQLSFSTDAEIYKLGVTDQFKQIVNNAGKTTESRAIDIDYMQTNYFADIDMHAYRAHTYVDDNNGVTGKVSITEVGPTAANQGLLLFCEGGGNVSCPLFVPAVNNAPVTYTTDENKMVANVTAGTAPASDESTYRYVFSNIYYNGKDEQQQSSTYGFYRVKESGWLKANMAYLELSKSADNIGYTNEYVLLDTDNSSLTDIEGVEIENGVTDMDNDAPVYFNLNGMRLNKEPSKKGIYIMNGKKIYVK